MTHAPGEPHGAEEEVRRPAETDPNVGASGTGWFRAARLGPVLLVIAMVVTALVAALSVTPGPDEEALARPGDADVVLAGGAPSSWDPARVSDAASAQILAQVFEGLTVLDAESAVRPGLAESWSVSADGLDMEFQLRPGITFSDGTPITAADVRRSWLRVLDPAHPSPLASLLADVDGATAYAHGEVPAEAVGIEADGGRLSLSFARPASYFPAVAAVPTLAVVPRGLDRLAGARSLPADVPVSGAYVPLERSGSQLRLVANPRYWAGPPALDTISVVTDDGGRSRVDVFEDGAVDWTTISEADADWIRYDSQLGPQLRRTEDMAVSFLGFDTTRPPFEDAQVRRAVAMAVDWRRLDRLEAGFTTPVTSLIPPGIPGRGQEDHLPAYDPEAARAGLSEAGYPGGRGFPAVALATYGVGATEAIAEELHRELGIEVAVERRPFAQHSALLDTDPPAMWTLAWNADYPHAHDFLGLLLRSDSSANSGGWSDPDYDRLIDAAAATTDPVEQERLYAEAQQIIRDEVPLVPLGYGGTWALSRDGLVGAGLSGVGIVRFAGLEWRR